MRETCVRAGLRLSYDHISVRRWLRGGVSQHPDIVAEVVSRAWGIPVPYQAIWPELREGAGPVPPELAIWTLAGTLEELNAFIGGDMLTRREILSGSVAAATGSALLTPIVRWLDIEPVGLAGLATGSGEEPSGRVGTRDVERIEQAIRRFAGDDAASGGGLSREDAVGKLKYAVELLRHAHYSDALGNWLVAAVAGLAGLVGWMCLDSGMSGPGQRYLGYGLQAARESTDPRAPLLIVRLLSDLAQHQRWTGQHATAARLFDLALSRLPQVGSHANLTRANVLANRAHTLACLGPSRLAEVRSSFGLAYDLHDQGTDDEREAVGALAHRWIDLSVTALAAQESGAYLTLSKEDQKLAGVAEEPTLFTVDNHAVEHGRNHTHARIRLAMQRFRSGEPEQGCVDGFVALTAAEDMMSTMVSSRLRELYADTEPYVTVPEVVEFRDRLRTATAPTP